MHDLYEYVKAQVDARGMVQMYLGEPAVKSGETWKWHSPFRERGQ